MIYLTKKEYEVIQLLADGLTDKEIGEKLIISAATVKTHVRNIRRKSLDTTNRIKMAISFIRGQFVLKSKTENPMYERILELVEKGFNLNQISKLVDLDYTATYNYIRRAQQKYPDRKIQLPTKH